MVALLRIGTKVQTIDRGARVHGRSPDKPEAIGTIRDHHRPYGRQSKDRSPPTFATGDAAWYDAAEVEPIRASRSSTKSSIHHATIRKGTRGRIVNVDNDQRAAFFDGARARVQERWYRPDMVVVELLDDGPGYPGGTWRRGTTGALPLRYFVPEQGKKSAKQLEREIAETLDRPSPGSRSRT